MEQAGLKAPDLLPARVQRNGEFEGAYLYIDKYEKEWRQANGYNTGELYEDAFEVVSGTDTNTNAFTLYGDILNKDRKDPALEDYMLDNLDMPNMFNYMAAISAAGAWDNNSTYNVLTYYDNANTGRWSHLPWDLDGSMQPAAKISPFEFRSLSLSEVFTSGSIYENVELRNLYLRRLRTVVDAVYSDDQARDLYNTLGDLHQADLNADLAKWPVGGGGTRTSQAQERSSMNGVLNIKKESMLAYQRLPWSLPAAQTQQEREAVFLDEVVANADNTEEYIKISNAADTPVDLSGWEIDGINYTIPAGAVVPANGSIYLLRDDVGYRGSHNAVLVAGQYTTDLGSSGTLTLKTDANVTIDDYDY